MSSISATNANASLSYKSGGVTNRARLRCHDISYIYSQNATESHARQHRAFYPHRRSQGSFTVMFECKGWAEVNALSSWLRNYAALVLNLGASDVPPPVTVSVPSRNFLRLGVPITGMDFGDHLGSMVFQPQITFISVNDPSDPSTSVLNRAQVSAFILRNSDPTVRVFFPSTAINRPGKLSDQIYAPPDPVVPSPQQVTGLIGGGAVVGTGSGTTQKPVF